MEQRPEKNSYGEHFGKYIEQVPDGDLFAILTNQGEELRSKLSQLNEAQSLYRYAPGKWSIKELIGHITDAERVFNYRLLRAARNDQTPLSGFDENLFVLNASFDKQPLSGLMEQFEAVRRGTLLLMRGLDERMWDNRGVVNGHETTVLAWACVIAGHEFHHSKVLEERYLPHV